MWYSKINKRESADAIRRAMVIQPTDAAQPTGATQPAVQQVVIIQQAAAQPAGAVHHTVAQQAEAARTIEDGRTSVVRLSKKHITVFALCIITAAGLFAKGSVDSETAKAYFEIAQAYADVSKYDKAVEFYQKAAKDPAHKNAAEYNLARVYGLQGEWGKAKSILAQQYTEAPGNIVILKAYAYSLAATGDGARACEMYKKLYDTDAENPEAALNYARILILSKRYDQALSFIEELKTQFTESADTKALAALEEKIKKAQEESSNQEKEAQTQDTAPQNQNEMTENAETKMGKAASNNAKTT
jgi:hypothetical protein